MLEPVPGDEMNYYYLGASLPQLTMDAKPSISIDDFRTLASEHMNAEDLQAVSDLESLWTAEPKHPFVRTWKSRETSLRNALVLLRASAAKKDSAPFLREPADFDSDSERAASEAAARTNPIEKEQVLDRYRWALLDTMAGFNTFSSEALLAYSIKLALAQRWSSMDADAGLKVAESVISRKSGDSASEEAVSETNESSE